MLGKVGAELGSMMSETKTTQGYHELEGTGGILPKRFQETWSHSHLYFRLLPPEPPGKMLLSLGEMSTVTNIKT